MLPFDFDYYRPDSISEAVRLFTTLDRQGKKPVYFGGGTEIITLGRIGVVYTNAVIDLKAIPECRALGFSCGKLVIGAGVSLIRLAESRLFPLMGAVCRRIADHTAQGKITVGGNICGDIIYHEAVLPLFLSDSSVVIAGEYGQRQVPIGQLFNEQPLLNRGELVIRFEIDGSYLQLPYRHVKKTRSEKIGYPLITLAAVNEDGQIRLALSGVCSFPFRSLQMEACLNEAGVPSPYRIFNTLEQLPAPLLNNLSGTPEYRRFVLKTMLMKLLTTRDEVRDV